MAVAAVAAVAVAVFVAKSAAAGLGLASTGAGVSGVLYRIPDRTTRGASLTLSCSLDTVLYTVCVLASHTGLSVARASRSVITVELTAASAETLKSTTSEPTYMLVMKTVDASTPSRVPMSVRTALASGSLVAGPPARRAAKEDPEMRRVALMAIVTDCGAVTLGCTARTGAAVVVAAAAGGAVVVVADGGAVVDALPDAADGADELPDVANPDEL